MQRTGPADLYGSTRPATKTERGGGGIGSAEHRGPTLADELMNDFSDNDNDETPLTEPIYNGRLVKQPMFLLLKFFGIYIYIYIYI